MISKEVGVYIDILESFFNTLENTPNHDDLNSKEITTLIKELELIEEAAGVTKGELQDRYIKGEFK